MLELFPEVRLGRLFAQLGFPGEDESRKNLWDISDEQLLAVLHRLRVDLPSRSLSNEVSKQTEAVPA